VIVIKNGDIYFNDITRFISGDPTDAIFQSLLKIWDPEKYHNIPEYYSQGEALSSKFEEKIYGSFSELYDLLIRKATHEDTVQRILEKETYALIVMDGLSLREAALLKNTISKEYHISFDYLFSTLPTETQFFTSRYFGYRSPSEMRKRKLPYNFEIVSRIENAHKLKRHPKTIVWSALPDKRFATTTTDFRVSDLAKIYSEVEDLLGHLLETLFESFEKVYLTSDHGYITDSHAWKGLREFPSDRRYATSIGENLKQYCRFVNGYWCLIGGYTALKRGKYTHVRHGGISFLEAMTPYLTIKS